MCRGASTRPSTHRGVEWWRGWTMVAALRSEIKQQTGGPDAFAGEFGIGVERVEAVIAAAGVQDAEGNLAKLARKAEAEEGIDLSEGIAGKLKVNGRATDKVPV